MPQIEQAWVLSQEVPNCQRHKAVLVVRLEVPGHKVLWVRREWPILSRVSSVWELRLRIWVYCQERCTDLVISPIFDVVTLASHLCCQLSTIAKRIVGNMSLNGTERGGATRLAASLTSRSAFSFPGTPTCPGTQQKPTRYLFL